MGKTFALFLEKIVCELIEIKGELRGLQNTLLYIAGFADGFIPERFEESAQQRQQEQQSQKE